MPTLDDIAVLMREFQLWAPTQMTLFTIVVFSVLASGFLYRLLSGSPYLTITVSLSLLYFSAMLANFLGRDVVMEGATEFQRAAFFSVIGQSVGALVLFCLFKAADRGR